MKIKIISAALTVVMFSGLCFGAFSSGDAGTSAAQFLTIGVGARAAGMGEAFAGMADDSTAIYWNPAGLSRIEGKSLSLMDAAWFEGVSYEWASYAQKIGKIGTFGIGVQYLGYGGMTQTDETGLDIGSVSPTDLAVSLSYARKLMGIDLGANIKYISSKITQTASAYAVDLGAMYPLMDQRLWLGAVVQNMGTEMKFIDEQYPLPFNVKIGGAYAFRPNWKVALDVNAPIDNAINIGAGTEYGYKINEKMNAAGRLGYNTTAKDTGGLNGISAGLGFTYLGYSIDYAFVPYGDLGNTQRISLSILWGAPGAAAEKPAAEKVVKKAVPVPVQIEMEPPAEVFTPEVKAAVAEIVIEAKKINFETGKSDIRRQDMPGLKRVAKMLKEIKPSKVRVEGYTDNVGTDDFNQKLSQKRAQAVKDYLITEGIDAGLLELVGYGKTGHIADNSTEDGRLENRRVEFVIISASGTEIRPQIKQ